LDVEKYLERICYDGPLDRSIGTLRGLHRSHILTVPFEDLDIHLGRRIVLDQDALFDKIVERRRGGFCYELNGLFAGLLREIGFEVEMLSAGVAGPNGFGPDFDHMALRVVLDEDWLADVGFGDSFIEPIRLEESAVTEDATGLYRVNADGPNRLMSRRDHDEPAEGIWNPQYRFSLEARELMDYQEMCVYQETSPESHFTQRRLCSLATETGRITLTDLKLIVTSNGVREERMLSGEDEFRSVLAKSFRIAL
jgi:N-hydroxyarylamine O-acetyltransferase